MEPQDIYYNKAEYVETVMNNLRKLKYASLLKPISEIGKKYYNYHKKM